MTPETTEWTIVVGIAVKGRLIDWIRRYCWDHDLGCAIDQLGYSVAKRELHVRLSGPPDAVAQADRDLEDLLAEK